MPSKKTTKTAASTKRNREEDDSALNAFIEALDDHEKKPLAAKGVNTTATTTTTTAGGDEVKMKSKKHTAAKKKKKPVSAATAVKNLIAGGKDTPDPATTKVAILKATWATRYSRDKGMLPPTKKGDQCWVTFGTSQDSKMKTIISDLKKYLGYSDAHLWVVEAAKKPMPKLNGPEDFAALMAWRTNDQATYSLGDSMDFADKSLSGMKLYDFVKRKGDFFNFTYNMTHRFSFYVEVLTYLPEWPEGKTSGLSFQIDEKTGWPGSAGWGDDDDSDDDGFGFGPCDDDF